MQYILIAFIVTFLTLLLLIKTRLARIALDQPNHRSLHTKVTPRTGGLAIMLGILLPWFSITEQISWLLLLAALVTISLVDDMRGLAVKWRFISQFVVCMIFIFLFLQGLEWWVCVGAILLLVWITNLYNFMDGSDGVAGGMGLFGFSVYAIAAYQVGDFQLAAMCSCVSSACFAFLFYNFHPAKVFMGDVGSIPLGFLVGAIGLYGWKQHIWPIWFPVLVFSPFIVDATVTLVRRLIKREKVWEAHKGHYYQRLVQLGWGHRKTALFEYFLMALVGGSSLLLVQANIVLTITGLALWAIIYVLLMRYIDTIWYESELPFKENIRNDG